jgi:uncharacterized protein (UPF0333 family)
MTSRRFDYGWIGLAVLVAIVIAGAVLAIHAFRHGSSDRSSKIASDIGAVECSQSEYGIVNKLTDSTSRFYDCEMTNGNYKCVTYEHGVENDVTAQVEVLFASTLGATKPLCIS